MISAGVASGLLMDPGGGALFVKGPEFLAENRMELLKVESDAITGVFHILVERDSQGEMTGLVKVDPEGNGTVYPLANLRQAPQVIKRMEGRDAVFVSVEKDFNEVRGGHARMRYLQNGVFGKYKNFRMRVEPQGQAIVARGDVDPQDPESDSNPYSSVFNYLYLKKNTFFGKVIGVEQVLPAQK